MYYLCKVKRCSSYEFQALGSVCFVIRCWLYVSWPVSTLLIKFLGYLFLINVE